MKRVEKLERRDVVEVDHALGFSEQPCSARDREQRILERGEWTLGGHVTQVAQVECVHGLVTIWEEEFLLLLVALALAGISFYDHR